MIGLIKNRGVTEFYSGCRGNFDKICADIVCELKDHYPHIRLIQVLSYHPAKEFVLSNRFDECVYLLDKKAPPKFAIYYTNRRLVELADFVLSGVLFSSGGAYLACKYAKKLNKVIEIEYEN